MFHYNSVQEHIVSVNGHEQIHRNIVKINNGKGIKKVEKYQNGKLVDKGTKKLTGREVTNIKSRKFMPGLFKGCTRNGKKCKKNLTRRKRHH
jgi:hypothetical protein